ncbi:unnamed protein product, partial [Mesorhabditis spiculigera]
MPFFNETLELPEMVTQAQIAGFLAFLASLVGIIANGMVIFWISRLPSMQNAFGRLTRNQATADFLHAWGFFLYMAPMLMFHLFVSINRVCSIFFPMEYPRLFSKKNVAKINVFCWMIAFWPSILAYRIVDCRFIYSEELWSYTFTVSPVCNVVSWYYDFVKSVATVFVIVGLDMITFVKCRLHGNHLLSTIADAQVRAHKRNEINFVTQSCLQGFIFILELLTFFVLANFVDIKMGKFALTTLSWIGVHALDGLIAIFFNKEFHHRVLGQKIETSSRHAAYSTQMPATLSSYCQHSSQNF